MHLGQTQDVSAGFGQHLGYENKNKLSLLIIYILNIWSGGWKSVITELNQKPWKQKTYNKTILRNFSYRLREPFIINHSYIYVLTQITSQDGGGTFKSTLGSKPQQPNTSCTFVLVLLSTLCHPCSASWSCCSLFTPRQAHATENWMRNSKNKMTMYCVGC